MKTVTALLLCLSVHYLPLNAAASEVVNQPRFDVDAIESFAAHYTQGGEPLIVTVTLSGGDDPMLHAVFGSNWDDASADKIGHRLPELTFAYRNVAGRMLVADGDSMISVGIQPYGPAEAHVGPLAQPVIDGTLSYWLLAASTLVEGTTVTPNVVMPDFRTTGGFWSRPAPFEVGGMEEVIIDNSESIACRLVTTVAGDGQFEACVATSPPYLIRQRYLPADGLPETVLLFEKLLPTP